MVIAGHAFVQNLRRGYYELAAEDPVTRRLAVAFESWPWRSETRGALTFGMPRIGATQQTRPDDQVIVEVARANPTDGTRMVAALPSRALGRPANRKRVQRVMRAHRLPPADTIW